MLFFDERTLGHLAHLRATGHNYKPVLSTLTQRELLVRQGAKDVLCVD